MTDAAVRAVTAHWERRAATFDDEPDHGLGHPRVRAAWASRLDRWLPPAPAEVVDLGCGTGSLTVLCAKAGHRVRGIDVAEAMVALARQKASRAGVADRTTFEVGDAGDPGLPSQSVDVVLVRHVVWTLPDPVVALGRWAEALRPGGRLILVEGRWAQPCAAPADEYATVSGDLPWIGGVTAAALAVAVEPLVDGVAVHDLTGDPDLWDGPVDDERYALIGHVEG